MDKWKLTPGDPQEDAPRQTEEKDKRRFLWLGITAAVVLAAVLLAVLWDPTEFDGLRRRLIYARAAKDENGCARLYQYGSDKSGCFASLDGSLLYLTDTQLLLEDESGETLYSTGVKFTHAAVTACDTLAAAYDIGGTELYILDRKGLVRQMTCDGTVISARFNQNGCLAVIAEKSGYKAAVYAYDPEGKLIFEFDSADRFVITAAVSRDGRSLAAITVGEKDGTFVSRAMVYRMTKTEPTGMCEVNGGILYEIDTLGRGYVAVGEDALYFLDSEGNLTTRWPFDSDSLRRCSLTGNGFAAVLLGRHRAGDRMRLVTLDGDGTVLREIPADGEVLSVSAAGRYLAVLYSDHLTIYDKNLTECAVLEDVTWAKQVLMRSDGSAVLAGSSSAGLYLP